MKKALIATAIAAALVAPQAFAQANNFAGFSAAANVNMTTATTEVSVPGASVKFDDNSQNVSLQAAYGLALGNNFVLGFGGTYALGDMKAGTIVAGANRVEMKGKDMYSLYIEPGFVLGNSTLAYAKVAYLGMKGEASATGAATFSDNFDGVGYGIGIRTMLDKNLFAQVEFMQSDYSAKTYSGGTYKPSATTGTIGIGYKF